MEQRDILLILKDDNLIHEGHFVYASGKHGSRYIDKMSLLQDDFQVNKICREIAERFRHDRIDVVIGPERGGAIMQKHVARYLTLKTGRYTSGLPVHKDLSGTKFAIDPEHVPSVRGRNVLIVDDIVTTGGSLRSVVEAVTAVNGIVAGIGAICNRTGVEKKDVGNPPKFIAIAYLHLDSWNKDECPLCQLRIPITPAPGK